MQQCELCPRKCRVDRTVCNGFCGVDDVLKVARAGLHFGEEPCISGSNGSGTVFFSGCSLKCVMCQNFNISHEGYGKNITVKRLAEIFKDLESLGAHNINLVTPTHYRNKIKEALGIYKPSIPIVCNTSGYETLESISEDIYDIYLFDLKFFSSAKSEKYSGCKDYFEVASEALKSAYNIIGAPVFDQQGILQKGIVVRHLILPQSTNDSLKIIEWLAENVPNVVFSLMSQYVPMYRASEFKEINRKITRREYEKVVDYCSNLNFTETYIQKLSSATKQMIPDFDLTGI